MQARIYHAYLLKYLFWGVGHSRVVHRLKTQVILAMYEAVTIGALISSFIQFFLWPSNSHLFSMIFFSGLLVLAYKDSVDSDLITTILRRVIHTAVTINQYSPPSSILQAFSAAVAGLQAKIPIEKSYRITSVSLSGTMIIKFSKAKYR